MEKKAAYRERERRSSRVYLAGKLAGTQFSALYRLLPLHARTHKRERERKLPLHYYYYYFALYLSIP